MHVRKRCPNHARCSKPSKANFRTCDFRLTKYGRFWTFELSAKSGPSCMGAEKLRGTGCGHSAGDRLHRQCDLMWIARALIQLLRRVLWSRSPVGGIGQDACSLIASNIWQSFMCTTDGIKQLFPPERAMAPVV